MHSVLCVLAIRGVLLDSNVAAVFSTSYYWKTGFLIFLISVRVSMLEELLMIVFKCVCMSLTWKVGDQVLMCFPNWKHLTSELSHIEIFVLFSAKILLLNSVQIAAPFSRSTQGSEKAITMACKCGYRIFIPSTARDCQEYRWMWGKESRKKCKRWCFS